ncbi:MAG: glycosyltransferase [Candidatus Hydrogenedentota bacterium]
MTRILLFCSQEWRAPDAARAEHYCYQVFSRLAREGYQVSWVCEEQFARRVGASHRGGVEVASGIQVARLGLPIVYPLMARMLLSRLARTGRLEERYDAVVDCVKSRPMHIPDTVAIPVVPLVFHLSRRTAVSGDPPSPFVAASHRAWEDLRAAGAGEQHIVYAPHGVAAGISAPADPGHQHRSLVAAVDDKPKLLVAALTNLVRGGAEAELALMGRQKPRRSLPGMEYAPGLTSKERAQVFQRAAIGFCGIGREHEAPAMMACGLPVLVPDTVEGREFARDGQTGLFYAPGSRASIEEQLQAFLYDEALRNSLAANARKQVQTTWDQTTQTIRTVIERA